VIALGVPRDLGLQHDQLYKLDCDNGCDGSPQNQTRLRPSRCKVPRPKNSDSTCKRTGQASELANTCSMLTSSSVGRTPAAVISQPCVRAQPNAAQGSAPSTSYSRPDPCTSRRAPRQRGLAARAAAVAEASTGLDVSTVCPHPRWQRAITSVGQPHEPCLHRVLLASIRFLRL